uniref:Uncharacterized protein n=1 Tax=Romanomermis culicivorax TaxID=13658 RepID=A0A915KNM7_ROMCU
MSHNNNAEKANFCSTYPRTSKGAGTSLAVASILTMRIPGLQVAYVMNPDKRTFSANSSYLGAKLLQWPHHGAIFLRFQFDRARTSLTAHILHDAISLTRAFECFTELPVAENFQRWISANVVLLTESFFSVAIYLKNIELLPLGVAESDWLLFAAQHLIGPRLQRDRSQPSFRTKYMNSNNSQRSRKNVHSTALQRENGTTPTKTIKNTSKNKLREKVKSLQ